MVSTPDLEGSDDLLLFKSPKIPTLDGHEISFEFNKFEKFLFILNIWNVKNPRLSRVPGLKVAFSQKVRFVFQISPKDYSKKIS